MFKVLNWNLHSFRLLEIIQVLDSISWVRCASGNVFYPSSLTTSSQQLLIFAWLHLSGPGLGVVAQCDAELPSGRACTEDDFFVEADPDVSYYRQSL